MSRRVSVVILILLAAAGGYWYYATRLEARALVLTGIVTTDEVIVSSQIEGRMSHLLVKEGDTVKRDQLIAVIDPQELQTTQEFYARAEKGAGAQVKGGEAGLRFQELQTADQIRQAQETLASMQAQQAEAAADLEKARLDNERSEGLFKQGIVSAQANDQARTTYAAAQAHLEGLRKQVDAQRATVALAQSNAEQVAMRQSQLQADVHQWAAAGAQTKTAQVRLGYTEIHSPIDGLVAERVSLQGEVVNPAQPIVALINQDNLWVRADVEESYIDGIRLGDHMAVRFPSGLEREGTVFYRGEDAGFATQRDVSRTKRDIKTFEIRLRVDNSDRRLYPGLTAYVTLPLKTP
ncbi:MAG TPA: efflux RND transporter periplasmic adaptor subunit [Terriglobia bacterium]|nr:efflux RND transporter periplasmic adaptor subunit [Terriglobia bacterium]